MFCIKCGSELEDGAIFCGKCNAAVPASAFAPAPARRKANWTLMIAALILCAVVGVSPFMEMYYRQFSDSTIDMCVLNMLEETEEIISLGNDMGMEFDIIHLQFGYMDDSDLTIMFAVAFNIIAFIIGFVHLIISVILIVGKKDDSEIKFWKHVSYTALAFFAGNTMVSLSIAYINYIINSAMLELPGYYNPYGVYVPFYAFEILAVAAYSIARVNYKALSKNKDSVPTR